jgi:CheY-like chemotaxis protein
VTASAMQGDREKALAAGFTGYIAKPVGLSQLRDEVSRLLGNS